MMEREKLLQSIEQRISKRRLTHTLGVEKTAIRLAERYGCDVEKTSIAALLHDVAKPYDKQAALEKAREMGVSFDVYERCEPSLMHGPLGAAIAEADYGVKDEEILSAIRYHTTGRKDMSLVEKIIYMADLIEPSREFEGLKQLRELCEKDLDQALTLALRREIVHVIECGFLLHPRSVEALDDLLFKKYEKEGLL